MYRLLWAVGLSVGRLSSTTTLSGGQTDRQFTDAERKFTVDWNEFQKVK